MQTTPRKRSTILVAVGAGVFVVGTGLAALATRDTGGTNTHNARSDTPVTAVAAGAGAVKSTASGATNFVIPPDHQAMAVSVPFVQGLAGYAKAGDVVNVYGEYRSLPANAAPEDPVAKLVLQKVQVLSVSPGADGGNATYILSVSTSDAEAVMYLSTFQKVWLTLARDDQGVLPLDKGFSIHNA
jgi:Flp pilus assembly protein CpaB